MKENVENELPKDFDGVFRFTNATTAEFVGVWNKVEYTFPPMKTTPMIIPGATPEEVQNIRKKFARDLATLQFYDSDKFQSMNGVKSIKPALYTDSDLEPYIQECLKPLPAGVSKAKKLPDDSIENYKGSKVLKGDESLMTGTVGSL